LGVRKAASSLDRRGISFKVLLLPFQSFILKLVYLGKYRIIRPSYPKAIADQFFIRFTPWPRTALFRWAPSHTPVELWNPDDPRVGVVKFIKVLDPGFSMMLDI
jgi:hypothetical protein